MWWREYTDPVEKKDTALNFLGLDLAVPLSWTDMIPYVDDIMITGLYDGKETDTDLRAGLR